MDPYFEIYVPRLISTLKLSKLRSLVKQCKPKGYNKAEDREMWRKSHEEIADKLAKSAENFFYYIGEKLVNREDKGNVSSAIWTIINVLESGNGCDRSHCKHNDSRCSYSCSAGKRTHTCKEYDKYMSKKAFGAEACTSCSYSTITKQWGPVCFMPQYKPEVPEGCPRKTKDTK